MTGYENYTRIQILARLRAETRIYEESAHALMAEGIFDAEPVLEWDSWHTCYMSARKEFLESLGL